MALFNPLSSAFGLDIGDRSFKLVQVAAHGRGTSAPRIVAWGSIDVPEGVMERGEIRKPEEAATLIAKLVRTAKGRVSGRAVAACLPEAKTFIKIIDIAKGADEDAQHAAVVKEIEQNIPLPLEEIYYDWQTLQQTAPVPAEHMAVVIGAAPKTLVDDYTVMLERSDLAPIALEIEAMAIARAVVPDRIGHDDAVGILDIGATRSSLVISDQGALRMSISIPISGIAITKLVSESLGVGMEDAEILKRECGLDSTRCEDKMWKILLPLIDDITEKIGDALRFYKIGFPEGKKVERLLLCGGGAQFHEIDTVLSRKLAIKVRRGDALTNVSSVLPHGFSKEESLQYTTAIGLALRAAEESGRFRESK